MKKRLLVGVLLVLLLQVIPFIYQEPIKLLGSSIEIDPKYFSLLKPIASQSYQAMSSSSATMSNSRFSYLARLNGTALSGATTITVRSSGTGTDINTTHLFAQDLIHFAGTGSTASYTVTNINDSTSFVISPALSSSATDNSQAYVNQQTTLSLRFTTASTIPASGKLIIYIPSETDNNSIPDVAGFDRNSLTNTDVSNIMIGNTFPTGSTTITTGTPPGSTTASIVITLTGNSGVIPSGTQTVIIGTTNRGLINPAPSTTTKAKGYADIYPIVVQSTDASSNELDRTTVKVAPVEGVLVSATIEEVLAFRVCGVNSNRTSTDSTNCYLDGSAPSSICGTTAPLASTAVAVPFGTIQSGTFYDAAQFLKISTNSQSGYNVTIEENDQMGKNGSACANYGDESSNPPCIKDTTCAASACTSTTYQDWTSASSYPGLGYSMDTLTGYGTDNRFTFNLPSGTYNAKQIPDQNNSTPVYPAQVMQNTAAVSNKGAYVCYRIAVSNTQPAGYYFNKIKYTATPAF
jgi:hypothetical protein